jgi:hypothetical protein
MSKRRVEIATDKTQPESAKAKKRKKSSFRLMVDSNPQPQESKSSIQKSLTTTNPQKNDLINRVASTQNYLEWIEKRLLKDLLENIQEYDFLRIYAQDEWGKPISKEKFLENILKAFFKRDDLERFKANLEELMSQEERVLQMEEVVQKLSKEIKKMEHKQNKIGSRLMDKQSVLELILWDFEGEIKKLLKEECDQEDSGEFIITFSASFRDILTTKELIKDKPQKYKLEEIYRVSSKLLKSISNRYITNRRRILSALAEFLSEDFDDYRFISAEDYTFVDPKIHNIIVKKGQKIKESLSFCVVKKETSQTIKYADVVTF